MGTYWVVARHSTFTALLRLFWRIRGIFHLSVMCPPRVHYGHARLAAKHQKLRRVRTSKGSVRVVARRSGFSSTTLPTSGYFCRLLLVQFTYDGRNDRLLTKILSAIRCILRKRFTKQAEKLRRNDLLEKAHDVSRGNGQNCKILRDKICIMN